MRHGIPAAQKARASYEAPHPAAEATGVVGEEYRGVVDKIND
jgi:hypothetical protein